MDGGSRGRVPALLLALVVLISVFVVPSAMGEENPAADDGATGVVEEQPTETEPPPEETIEEPTEETPVEEPVVEEPVVEEPTEEVPAEEPTEDPAGEEVTEEAPAEETAEESTDESTTAERVGDATQTMGKQSREVAPQGKTGGGKPNKGTVKVDGVDFDDHQNNEPHVGCVFEIDYYKFKEGDSATYSFELKPPTGTAALNSGSVQFGPEAANGLVASTGPIDLSALILASGEAPHPIQGYHVKLTSTTPNGKKFKTFWVEGCNPPPPPPPDCPNGYTLTTIATPAGGGTISDPGNNPHVKDSSVNLTATPTDATWAFDGWTGDGTGDVTRNVSFTGPDCDLEVTATFSQPAVPDCPNGYTLTTTATPAGGGTISDPGPNPHVKGSSVDLTATPTDATWVFDGWTGDGTGDVTRNVSFTGADCDLEVTATFSQPAVPDCANGYTLTTTSDPAGGGTISGAGSNLHTGGTSVTLTAVPTDERWTFNGWTGDGTDDVVMAGAGGGALPTRTVQFTGADCDLAVTALFSQPANPDCPNGYTLTTFVDPDGLGAGTIEGAESNPHLDGTSVQLTAMPSTGWIFTGWSGDGTGDETRTVDFTGTDCDLEVTGEFAEVLPLPPIEKNPKDPKDPRDEPTDPRGPAKRPPTVLGTRLPFTGAEVVTYVWLAALLMGMGAAAVSVTRRRRGMLDTEEDVE